MTEEPKINTLAPWFGSNRMQADAVGRELGKLDWCGVVFAGGMSELQYIKARGVLVNDLHRDIINLARVVADSEKRAWLTEMASQQPFHPDVLVNAQRQCRYDHGLLGTEFADASRALWYFTCAWMGRSAKAGTKDEFKGGLSHRFTASGGGSNVRYRAAIESLDAFGEILKGVEFSTLDFREFLGKCHDRKHYGLYIDAPWPGDGDAYKHPFTESDQVELARLLQRFELTRVVVRFGDHPLIRKLYPADRWNWRLMTSRTQANEGKAEALIVNGPLAP